MLKRLRALAWGGALEAILAIALILLGVRQFLLVKTPTEWPGLALIALGVIAFMIRGQTITKFQIGSDGVVAELKEKTQKALEKAADAQKSADLAKQVVTDYAGPPATAAEPARAAANRWAHPALVPGPKVPGDMQKNQWGGRPARNGRVLGAEVTQEDKNWYRIRLWVAPDADGLPLTGKVRFHLHESFARTTETVPPVDGRAEIERVAYGAFTVGAEVEGEPDTFLELDLAAPDFDAPADFKAH